MSDPPVVKIAVLETEVEYLKTIICEMRTDVREIRDTLSQARGGWRTLMLVAGISSTIGALSVKMIPWLGAIPR